MKYVWVLFLLIGAWFLFMLAGQSTVIWAKAALAITGGCIVGASAGLMLGLAFDKDV